MSKLAAHSFYCTIPEAVAYSQEGKMVPNPKAGEKNEPDELFKAKYSVFWRVGTSQTCAHCETPECKCQALIQEVG